MAGYDSTCGLAVRTFAPAPADAVLVSLLKEQGAIPFVRTNVPQLLMLPEVRLRMTGTRVCTEGRHIATRRGWARG